jgi:hypothetical protein
VDNKMSQKIDLLNLFHINNNQLTLGHILQTNLCAEYRARMTDLRRDGYVITCERGGNPSQNIYRLIEADKDGQIVFA